MDLRNSSYGHITPLRTIKRDSSFNTSGSRLVNSNRFSPFGTSSPKPKLLLTNKPGSPAMKHSLTGPLLTSINFNSNLSTYMDSKSPGLAERVVQYNKSESPKPCITHQPKYGSPGIFPVVHLFKKTIPVRTISPSHKVTVRMAAQDVYQSYNNDNRSQSNQLNSSNEVEKSSVLEALKNISRKRMLAEDDYIPPNNSKRHCRELDETEVTIESQPTTSKDGVPFVINAITASLSSSHPHLIPSLHKKTSTTNLVHKTALCNMETQTETNNPTVVTTADIHETPSESKKKILETDDESPKDDDANCGEIKNTFSSITSPVDEIKLLKEKQLESVKRNKLTKFLCLLSRESSDKAASDVFETDSSPKNTKITTSILSPENKPKHNRRVTFDLPEKEKVKDLLENTKTDVEVAPFTLNNVEPKNVEGFGGNSKENVVLPVSNNKENGGFGVDSKKENGGFGVDSKKENGGFSLGQINPNLSFTFGQTTEKEVSKEEKIPAVPVMTITSDLNTTKPTPSLPQMFTPSSNESPLPMSSSPKLGGFKFDFKSPTPAAKASPQFGSGDTTRLFNVSTSPPSNTISNQTNVSNSNVTFGLSPPQSDRNPKSVSPSSTSGIFSTGFGTNSVINSTLGSNTNVSSSSNVQFSTGFGTVAASNPISSPPKTNMMQPNATTIFSPANSPAKSVESNTNVTSRTASMIFSTGFGTTTTNSAATSAPFSFGAKNNNEPKSFGINFGIPSAQNSNENKSLFTAPTLAPTNVSQSQGFASPTSANNMFSNKFGSPANSFNTATSNLSAPPPFPTLTATTTAAATSNNAFTSVFPNNEQKPSLPTFGTNNVTNTTTSSLTNENQKTNSFGNSGSTFTFGSAATSPSFGNTFQFGRDKNNVAEPVPQKPSMFDASATKPKTDFFKFGSTNPPSNVASPFNTSTTLAAPAFNAPSASNRPSAFNSGATLPNATSPFNSNPKPVSTFQSSFGANQPFDLSSGAKPAAPSFNMAPNSANPVPSLPNAPVPAFNNMFGSVPTTMFNAQPNPNFSIPQFNNNANNGAPPQFGAVQPGIFNIGTGSATPRNRTTLKARRRT